jgi:hypothetical protein
MKIQHTPQQQLNRRNDQSFKGVGDVTLRYLAVNQAVGANGVDVAFMVTPRTTSDIVRRGPLAGMETFRREIMGTVNDSLIGVYGIGAGAIAASLMGFSKKYGAKVNEIFAAPETLNILAENKAHQVKNQTSQLEYLQETLKNLKAFNPSDAKADKDGYVRLSDKTIEEAAEILDKSINNEGMNFRTWAKDSTENSLNTVVNKITADTGAQSKYILESGKEHLPDSETNLKTLLEDLFKVSQTFNKEKVKEAFEAQVKEGKNISENAYIKQVSKFMKTKAFAGFTIGSAVGLSVQPINMYLTKLKTGSDGFVGVEGRSKDNSTGFKAMKIGSAAAFFGMILATLGTGIKGFMGKMAFKGFWPTISQLKGIYGVTIISRIMSARDPDELRESLTKDTLGYFSWLVLGDFINKITADAMDKSVMNRTKEVEGKGYFSKIFNSSLKTRDEILIKTLADNNIETVKTENGKKIAKTFSELLKDLDKLSPEIKKKTRKQLSVLNKAQAAGYLFSGLVLGLGIPNLNIYITNTLDKKRKAKAAQQAQSDNASVATNA